MFENLEFHNITASLGLVGVGAGLLGISSLLDKCGKKGYIRNIPLFEVLGIWIMSAGIGLLDNMELSTIVSGVFGITGLIAGFGDPQEWSKLQTTDEGRKYSLSTDSKNFSIRANGVMMLMAIGILNTVDRMT